MKKRTSLDRGRSSTGISGLDDILGGGLPANRLYLLEGKPGTGKTTLALEYLLAGARAGEKVLYITLSETRDELQEVADSHGWPLDGLDVVELTAIGAQLEASAQNTLFHSSEVELTQTTKMLLDEVERVHPARVVFDSISELRLLSQSPLRYRRQILALKQYFAGRKCTTLLLDDSAEEDPQLKSLAHGILVLEQLAPEYGSERRRLMVLKIRGSKYRGGYHDFSIQTGGLSVFPRLIAAEHRREFKHDSISSGIKNLDELLGGGLTRGTSNLFIGPAGSGKSTIAMKFLLEAAKRGEKSAVYSFDETLGTILARADKLGLELRDRMEEGLIKVHQVDPAEMSPGEFAFAIKAAVERDGINIVQIDSLNGFLHAMGDERFLNLQLHELVTYLNQQGIVTIMMLAPHGMLGQMRTPLDVTYLADTVIALRYYEASGAVHKAISVIKKRTGGHERTIREVNFDGSKIVVGRPLTKFRGIFSGTPAPESTSRSKGGAHESV